MAPRWIPAAELIARAGSFEKLLPYLQSGQGIPARADRFTRVETFSEYRRHDGSLAIRREMWTPDWNPRHDGGSRFLFTPASVGDIWANDVEFDAEVADKVLPPPATLPTPIAPEPAAADPSAPPRRPKPVKRKGEHKGKRKGERKGGNRRGLVWDEVILPCLAAKFKADGPFIDEQAAIVAARACLTADPKKRELGPDALRAGVRKWCRPRDCCAQSRGVN
jgi:hypothetical protein